ncbi:MAG: hypothetical protein KY476_16870 [Planctomycetes bacterium]|nr:hypothetical protein [Planctomycetota bacterium]
MLSWIVWWFVLLSGWLLLASRVSPAEISVGAAAAALAAGLMQSAHVGGFGRAAALVPTNRAIALADRKRLRQAGMAACALWL